MKRNLAAAILGLALTGVVESAKAQGVVAFENYGFSTYAPITYTPGGAGVNNTFTAGLWYFLGTATVAAGNGTDLIPAGWELAPVTQTINSGATAGPSGAGLFVGGAATIDDYVAGPITFIVIAYQGSDWNSSIVRAHSASFTLPTISTGQSPVGEFGPGLTTFAIGVPEPSILALSGLGAAALMLVRRKNLQNWF